MLLPPSLLAFWLGLQSLATQALAAPIDEESLLLSRRTHGHHTRARLSESCQAPKSSASDPLEGCPKGTVFVSQHHPRANYTSINAALRFLPDDGSTRTILIDQGVYNEKVVVSRVSPTVFAGITSNVRDPASNQVTIWQSTYVNQSDPLDHKSNCDAVVLSVGAGTSAGSCNFRAYNIDFTQRQFQNGQEITQTQLGPAAALCVLNSNASFYSCGFSSYQDTLYVGTASQAFFFKSIIKGMTDQLYGSGKAWFERVHLLSRACGGGITAWRGDPDDPSVGVYVANSNIDRSPDASTLKPMEGKCHLGRPWNVFSHAVYLNTSMSGIVADEGFKVWSKADDHFEVGKTRFAEYGSSGPGGNVAGRNTTLETILSDKQAKQITYKKVFGGDISWIDTAPLKSS